MTPTKIRLNTEGFRAINSADIVINGITVVAGENGCGKSTLSKLLYYVYKTVLNYDHLASRNLISRLSDINAFIEIALSELFQNSSNRSMRLDFNKEFSNLKNDLSKGNLNEESMSAWLDFIDKIDRGFSLKRKDGVNMQGEVRLSMIAKNILQIKPTSDEAGIPFSMISEKIDSLFKESLGLTNSRSTTLFKNELQNIFHDAVLPSRFDVYELGELIVSMGKTNLSLVFGIKNVIYIDTPMMVGINSENDYWRDLNGLLKKKNANTFGELSNIISEEIIHGDASFETEILSLNDFTYKRSDGSVFNLLDCATGVKSFSILQLLLKNGSLDDKTLLIIDEPESHLHPQWIVEYARLIVLLNKNIGIKFFVASHNPDMVSAIRYISESQETLETLNFYLAHKNSPNSFSYDYKYLGTEINDIFKSFNIALERMDLYGGTDNEI